MQKTQRLREEGPLNCSCSSNNNNSHVDAYDSIKTKKKTRRVCSASEEGIYTRSIHIPPSPPSIVLFSFPLFTLNSIYPTLSLFPTLLNPRLDNNMAPERPAKSSSSKRTNPANPANRTSRNALGRFTSRPGAGAPAGAQEEWDRIQRGEGGRQSTLPNLRVSTIRS